MRTILALALAATALPASADTPPQGDETATIIVYRPGTLAGAAVACPVRHEDQLLVELGRNKAFVWRVKPGSYLLENKKGGVKVEVGAGETKYVRCVMKLNLVTYSAKLRISDASEYGEVKGELEQPGE